MVLLACCAAAAAVAAVGGAGGGIPLPVVWSSVPAAAADYA